MEASHCLQGSFIAVTGACITDADISLLLISAITISAVVSLIHAGLSVYKLIAKYK